MIANSSRAMTMTSLLIYAAAVLLLGCQVASPGIDPMQVRLGQEFQLRAGQQAIVEGEGLRVRFVSVLEDSRCPEDVRCIWGGNAEVLVNVEAGVSRSDLKLNTHGADDSPKEVRYQQYSVGLVSLKPGRRTDTKIKAEEYVLMLIVRKV